MLLLLQFMNLKWSIPAAPQHTTYNLIVLAAGVAVGALLGVLFAPDKGCVTRKKINEQGKKMAEELKEKINKGKEGFTNLAEDLQSSVKENLQDFVKHVPFRNVVD